MPRKPRIHMPGGLYHVILRGNARQDIFFTEADRLMFYSLLEEGVLRFDYRVHAFCLMSNHVHLAMQMGAQPLSKGLQNLAFRFTRHINRTQNRVGHLFQGRYTALLVDEQAYGLELVRYIHLNPVRARIVHDPAAYPHSGHPGYIGKRKFPFLTTGWVLALFDARPGVARGRYARFVAEGISEGRRIEFHAGTHQTGVVGDERFVQAVAQPSPEQTNCRGASLDRVVMCVCQELGVTEADLIHAGKQRTPSQARAVIGWLASSTSAATLSEVARRFQRDLSGISRSVTGLDALARTDPAVMKRLARLRGWICEAGRGQA
jgi:REP element-mobilizing transposase RayT